MNTSMSQCFEGFFPGEKDFALECLKCRIVLNKSATDCRFSRIHIILTSFSTLTTKENPRNNDDIIRPSFTPKVASKIVCSIETITKTVQNERMNKSFQSLR